MRGNSKEIIEGEVVHETAALATVAKPDMSLVLAPVMDISLAKKRLAEFQEFVAGYLCEGEDFGKIPGTPKPTLYKPGADKLCELYGLADTYRFAIPPVEDFKADPALFDYTIECSLWRGERLIATGMGSCNSYESKYKLRDQKAVCPLCHKPAIIKSKEEYGGGWRCWKKQEGCGAKFSEDDPKIVSQAGKVVNDDIATLKNTVLKMAKKRAKIDATLSATRSSGVFTQDIEDIGPVDNSNGAGTRAAAQQVAERKKSEHAGRKSAIQRVSVLVGHTKAKVYGQGLTQLLALLDQHDPTFKAKHMAWDEDLVGWFVDKAFGGVLALNAFCQAHQIECEIIDRSTGEVKESTHAEPQGSAPAPSDAQQRPSHEAPKSATLKDGKLFGPLTSAELLNTRKKGGKYLKCTVGGEYTVSLFDNREMDFGKGKGIVRVFDELLRSNHNPVEFKVVQNGQYLNVESVLQIGCYLWEEDGTPVIRREAATREPGEEVITDEDLGI